MSDSRKRLVLALAVTLLTAVLLGSGILIGSFLEIRSLRQSLSEAWRAELMGDFITPGGVAGSGPGLPRTGGHPGGNRELHLGHPERPHSPSWGAVPGPGTRGNATINRQQFRSTRELPAQKEAGVTRIFITGGSVAFGAGAPSQDRTIGGYLEGELNRGLIEPRLRVYTLANPAWASTQERILIENRLSEWQPDLVISFSGLNDMHWGQMGRDVMWFRTYHDQLFWSLNDSFQRLLGGGGLVDVQETGDQPVAPPLVAARLAKNVQLATVALRMRDSPISLSFSPRSTPPEKSWIPGNRLV